jgi:hypothetical protein
MADKKELRHRERSECERVIFEAIYQGGRRRELSASQAEARAEDLLEMLREDGLLRKAVSGLDQEIK